MWDFRLLCSPGVMLGFLPVYKVQALGLVGEVGVLGNGQADIGEDLVVIGPGGIGEVDSGLGLRGVELGEEETAQMDGAGSRDGLEGTDL